MSHPRIISKVTPPTQKCTPQYVHSHHKTLSTLQPHISPTGSSLDADDIDLESGDFIPAKYSLGSISADMRSVHMHVRRSISQPYLGAAAKPTVTMDSASCAPLKIKSSKEAEPKHRISGIKFQHKFSDHQEVSVVSARSGMQDSYAS